MASLDAHIHQEDFIIRASETASHQAMHMSALAKLLQEVAGNNARSLAFDITDMQAQNLSWVLHRLHIQIKRMPQWREKIQIQTWPALGDAIRAYRNYEVLDSEGNTLVHSLSYWMVLDLNTRKATRIPESLTKRKFSDRALVLPASSKRLKPFDSEVTEHSVEFKTHSFHLDMNKHVNNTHYLDWLLEILNEQERSELQELDVVFLRELYAHQSITVQRYKQQVQILDASAQVIALAEWS